MTIEWYWCKLKQLNIKSTQQLTEQWYKVKHQVMHMMLKGNIKEKYGSNNR